MNFSSNFGRRSFIRLLRIAGATVLILAVVGYAIWRSLNYALGPEIHISSPTNGSAIASSSVTLEGQVLRVNAVSLNGRPISVDEQGNFHEPVIIFPGLNTITFTATDQFGRAASKELDLVGTSRF